MLETFSNIYDSYQKILQKFSFHESRLIKRNRASIEISFQSIKQESNTDRIKPRPHDIIPNHFEVFSFFLVQLFMFLWIYIVLNTLSLFQLNIIIFFIFFFFSFTFIIQKKKKKNHNPPKPPKKKERKKEKMVSLNLQSLTMANLVYHLVYLTMQMQWPNFHCDMQQKSVSFLHPHRLPLKFIVCHLV